MINSIEESVKKAIEEDYKADKEKLEKAVDKAQETVLKPLKAISARSVPVSFVFTL